MTVSMGKELREPCIDGMELRRDCLVLLREETSRNPRNYGEEGGRSCSDGELWGYGVSQAEVAGMKPSGGR